MTNPTNPFNWQMPTASDLVTDLPADFETFGQAVATSMADLLGGTTGQVLSKASNTDMDFTWVAQDDSNAIQNAIVDAKGDLIAASAADTPARLAVGNNGETLVADSSTSTGLRYQGNYAAGKNAIINGDFRIWQRGTSFTSPANAYTADRWHIDVNTGSLGTGTITQQTFTPGTAPVAGYEGQFFWRYNLTATGTSTFHYLGTKLEDVRLFAGQTATLSFWGKADSARTITSEMLQIFGSGGSSGVVISGTTHSLTTSWQRFTVTFSVPSISGKTIGTSSFLYPRIYWTAAAGATIDTWGWQLESGSVATAFQTATGTIQGETSACQRYYIRTTGNNSSALLGTLGFAKSTSLAVMPFALPVTMRSAVSAIDVGGTPQIADGNTGYSGGTWALDSTSSTSCTVTYTHGSASLTQYRPYFPQATTGTSYIGFSAEL